jgi:Zn-dependent protease
MLVFGVLLLALHPLSVLVHALVARSHGVEVRELVARPEGRTASFELFGLRVRMGMGLQREVGSRDPEGWVTFVGEEVSPHAARQILLAGPLASGAFGVVLLALAFAHFPPPGSLFLGLSAASNLMMMVGNLVPDKRGLSDGAQLRALRQPPPVDPNELTSVPPPGWKRP